jgi:diguanylate cyclase (GGDEF)-like protein
VRLYSDPSAPPLPGHVWTERGRRPILPPDPLTPALALLFCRMIPLLRRLELRPRQTTWFALAASVVLGGLNFLAGWEVGFSVLYLPPIAALAWVRGRVPALALSIFCAAVWGFATAQAGFPASHPLILAWNAFARFLFFGAVALLLVSLREALDREARLARTDPLTGVGNSRAFREAVTSELARAQRDGRPFSLIYLDLDGFKQVNDKLGHGAGDGVLVRVATLLQRSIRRTDFVARLGGDEFALLLPQAGMEGARVALRRISARGNEAIAGPDWPITFSAGAVVCDDPEAALDSLLQAADELMYQVKAGGKAGFRISPLSPATTGARSMCAAASARGETDRGM